MSDVFVKSLYTSLIKNDVLTYRQLFDTTVVTPKTDPYWVLAMNFYNKLDDTAKRDLFVILEQVMVETTAGVLGVMDGVTLLDGCDIEPKVLLDGFCTNNDLQDSFLKYVELLDE